jgi:hypothetical protein
MIWNLCRLGMLSMVLGSCSLLTMRGVDPKWYLSQERDRQQEPDCAESYEPVFVDLGIASAIAVATEEVYNLNHQPQPKELVVAVAATSLLLGVSALIGADRYRECRRAKAELHVRAALGESHLKADVTPTTSRVLEKEPQHARGPSVRADVNPTTSRGYFCTYAPSIPELHTCVRERIACEHARKALAIPDGEACVSRDRAWCFDIHGTSRCFGTQLACEERSAAAPAGARACTERS